MKMICKKCGCEELSTELEPSICVNCGSSDWNLVERRRVIKKTKE